MENEQFAQPDKATFLLVMVFFPFILVGFGCVVAYQESKVWWALRKARKSIGRDLDPLEKLVVDLDTRLGLK